MTSSHRHQEKNMSVIIMKLKNVWPEIIENQKLDQDRKENNRHPKKSQKKILAAKAISSQKKNRQVAVLEKQNIKVKILYTLMFWTACYNNNCRIHYFRNGSGWFPQKLYRRRSIYIMSK